MGEQPFTQVDAFTDRPFAGNPAAVCLLPAPRGEEWMRHVAREMNLSETAFLVRRDDGFDLRWFTPAVEVELCGHATLASAHALWESGELDAGAAARFHTLSGLLTAERGDDGLVWLDFPLTPPEPADPPPELAPALGARPRFVGRSRFDYLAELGSEDEVRALEPDFRRLAGITARGVIVTAPSARPDADFVSRYFAPAAGIDEDPATGSAHCTLGPFWAERLGRSDLVGRQLSARGGVVRVRVAGDHARLGGRAVTVLRGVLRHAGIGGWGRSRRSRCSTCGSAAWCARSSTSAPGSPRTGSGSTSACSASAPRARSSPTSTGPTSSSAGW
jgi:PhzF family phenazine biosynthesis protein